MKSPCHTEALHHAFGGLNKRDYFAALALQGLLSAGLSPGGIEPKRLPEIYADLAVDYAEALIVELNQSRQEVEG